MQQENAKRNFVPYEDLIQKIPVEYQEEIIRGDFINQARPSNGDQTIQYLVVIYQNYIDANIPTHCSLCLTELLKKWQALQPALLAAVQARKMLDNL